MSIQSTCKSNSADCSRYVFSTGAKEAILCSVGFRKHDVLLLKHLSAPPTAL